MRGQKTKVLNLYAGIGGNRKLWKDVDVTAIELNPDIAKIYQDFFPDDKVIVADAHQYLLEHYKEFDFIWSSPPCPTHSRIRKFTNGGRFKELYPDMKLYEEIIFLKHTHKGKWVVENVKSYYKPLIPPYESGRHYFWSNFYISNKKMPTEIPMTGHRKQIIDKNKFWSGVKVNKQYMLNATHPELGLHIFNSMNNQELRLAL